MAGVSFVFISALCAAIGIGLSEAAMSSCPLHSVQPLASCPGPYKLLHPPACDGDECTTFYSENDLDLAERAKVELSQLPVVTLGVMDKGIYFKDDPYLTSHMADAADPGFDVHEFDESKISGSTKTKFADRKNIEFKKFSNPGAPETNVGHGTQVGAIAAWGSPNVKLVDIFAASYNSVRAETKALSLAWIAKKAFLEKNLDLMTVSLGWSGTTWAEIGDFMIRNPSKLLLITQGNTNFNSDNRGSNEVAYTENGETRVDQTTGFSAQDLLKYFHPAMEGHVKNILLVDGAYSDGRFHEQRGFGLATDFFAPSDPTPVYDTASLLNHINDTTGAIFAQTRLEGKDPWSQGYDDNAMKAIAMQKCGGEVPQPVQSGSSPSSVTPSAPVAPCKAMIYPDEAGISFGLPMVANVAAKCKQLCNSHNGAQIAECLRSSVVVDALPDKSNFAGKAMAPGILNPLTAYDICKESCTEGKHPHIDALANWGSEQVGGDDMNFGEESGKRQTRAPVLQAITDPTSRCVTCCDTTKNCKETKTELQPERAEAAQCSLLNCAEACQAIASASGDGFNCKAASGDDEQNMEDPCAEVKCEGGKICCSKPGLQVSGQCLASIAHRFQCK